MCAQRRLRSAWASQRRLRSAWASQRRLRSAWADAQADLSLRWAHMPFCWLCHAVAHFWFSICFPAIEAPSEKKNPTEENNPFQSGAFFFIIDPFQKGMRKQFWQLPPLKIFSLHKHLSVNYRPTTSSNLTWNICNNQRYAGILVSRDIFRILHFWKQLCNLFITYTGSKFWLHTSILMCPISKSTSYFPYYMLKIPCLT